jgi:hypothetical protein
MEVLDERIRLVSRELKRKAQESARANLTRHRQDYQGKVRMGFNSEKMHTATKKEKAITRIANKPCNKLILLRLHVIKPNL